MLSHYAGHIQVIAVTRQVIVVTRHATAVTLLRGRRGGAGGGGRGRRTTHGRRLGRILQELAKLLRKRAEADAGEEVDGKTRVAGVGAGKNALKVKGEVAVFQALLQLEGSEVLRDFLEENLDENAAAAGSFRFV